MPRSAEHRRLGLSVRIPLEDQADYRVLAEALGDIPVARLLVLLILEVALVLAKKEVPKLAFAGLITAIQRNRELSAVCRRIVVRDSQSDESRRTQALWLGFQDSERDRMSDIWRSLHWTEGKLMTASLKDAMTLGGLEGPATQAPVVPTLYRSICLSQERVAAEVLSEINPLLESARRERKRERTTVELKPLATEPQPNREKRTDQATRDSLTLFRLGQKSEGDPLMVDLAIAETSNVLIAGSAGSGRSELLKTIVAGLMARNDEHTLQLALIDPKRLTFVNLERSPFLICRPIESAVSAVHLLEATVKEIKDRYQILSTEGQSSGREAWSVTRFRRPTQVLVFDDFGELVFPDHQLKGRFEELILRIATTGRAVGIHLILATQTIDDDVIAGPIKANLPARVCLKVPSATASRLVIGATGAEALQGAGELLCDLGRGVMQARSVLVSQDELERLASRPRSSPFSSRYLFS